MAGPFTDRAKPAAQAALNEWGNRLDAITATAIAGAETNWIDSPGDPLDIFPEADRPTYELFAVDGFTSFGQWQCNLRWNHQVIYALAQVNEPQAASQWLLDVNNCAKAAHEIFVRQGWGAWSTYNAPRFHQSLAEATAAVDSLTTQSGEPAQPTQDDLVNLLGYLQGDVADALEEAELRLGAASTPEEVAAAGQSFDAAITTLRTAGKI